MTVSSRRERGGVTLLMAGMMVVMITILVGVAAVGRLAFVRADAQRAADSACLLAANVVRQEGLPFDAQKKRQIERIAFRNLNTQPRFGWDREPEQLDDRIQFSCRVEIDVGVPWGTETVVATAKGSVPQTRIDEATKILPKFVMVLDYSGSMRANLLGDSGSKKAYQVLQDSVKALLELDLEVQYGAVLFDHTILKSIPIGPDAPAQIKQAIGRQPAGMTSTWKGLDEAKKLLTTSAGPGNYHVLLVTDGEPHDNGDVDAGIAMSQAAAQRLWDIPTESSGRKADTAIFTLHVRVQGSAEPQKLEDFLRSISGKASKHPIDQAYMQASTTATLQEQFRKIADILACQVQLAVAPAADQQVFVFLQSPDRRQELALPDLRSKKADAIVDDLNDPEVPSVSDPYRNHHYYMLDRETSSIYLTKKSCDTMKNQKFELIIRTGRPHLTE